jgi:hypothetical protein
MLHLRWQQLVWLQLNMSEPFSEYALMTYSLICTSLVAPGEEAEGCGEMRSQGSGVRTNNFAEQFRALFGCQQRLRSGATIDGD